LTVLGKPIILTPLIPSFLMRLAICKTSISTLKREEKKKQKHDTYHS